MDYIQPIITILAVIGAILAWVAKIIWSKQHLAAKNEIIRAKEEQLKIAEREVKTLREQTPPKLREYFDTVQASLEEYNDYLQEKVQRLEGQLLKKSIHVKPPDYFKKQSKRVEKESSKPREKYYDDAYAGRGGGGGIYKPNIDKGDEATIFKSFSEFDPKLIKDMIKDDEETIQATNELRDSLRKVAVKFSI